MRKVLKRFLFIYDCNDWLYLHIVYKNLPVAPTGFYWSIASDSSRSLMRKYKNGKYCHIELVSERDMDEVIKSVKKLSEMEW